MANEKKVIVSEYDISEILKYASKRVADQKLVTGTSSVDEVGFAISGSSAFLATEKTQNTINRGYIEGARNSIMKRVSESGKNSKDINSIFKSAFKESKKIG